MLHQKRLNQMCKIIPTLKERRADIPANWIIFNAHRPLVGALEWQGEFLEGIFYAAVDPSAQLANWQIEYNTRMAAITPKYITIDDVKSWMQKLCDMNGYDISILEDDDDYLGMFWSNYFRTPELAFTE